MNLKLKTEERGQEYYFLYFCTLFSNEVSDRTNYIIAVSMPITAENRSSQMFCWREKMSSPYRLQVKMQLLKKLLLPTPNLL